LDRPGMIMRRRFGHTKGDWSPWTTDFGSIRLSADGHADAAQELTQTVVGWVAIRARLVGMVADCGSVW
jgi:hypothetical protein